LLIIDDVQFFAGKRATLVELQHTIDTLLREGRQLVFAADRAPADLPGLGPELITRLAGGLVTGLAPPEHATRIGVVRRLAGQLNVLAPEVVYQWIATHLTCDARQFSGALNRLKVTAAATGQPITLAMAEESLSELVRAASQAVGLKDIERAVCDVFGLDSQSLHSDGKSKAVSHPRMLAMWLARKHTRAALSEISRFFGRRSHSTVISAQKKVCRWVEEGAPLDLPGRPWKVEDAIRKIEGELRAG
jgi:chromosomal replication initiator protein